MTTKYTIEYTFGPYSGTETVYLDEGDTRDPVDILWARLRQRKLLTLSNAYQSARIVNAEEAKESDIDEE